jgi:hypothetical protein
MAGKTQGGRPSLDDLRLAARFLWDLPPILRRPLTPERARAILRARFERRETDLLALAARAIYPFPTHPYRRLLRAAGCEYGDLETLVRRHGVDDALRTLVRAGVYLSIDEFKGRRPVTRGGLSLHVDLATLRNPAAQGAVPARSSGSVGAATTADVDLEFVRDLAVNQCLVLHARGGTAWRHALWHVPGSAALKRVLWLTVAGSPPERWFSPLDLATTALHPRYRWSIRGLRWVSRAVGIALPGVTHAPPQDPTPLLRWMREVLAAGEVPHVATYASGAVRLADAAIAAGIDLRGAQLTISGEPTTRARLAAVRRSGATAVPQYGASEAGGTIGHGCLAPTEADDLHLFHDLRAVIQPGDELAGSGVSPATLLLTSLRPRAPFVLLNVSLGDRAVLARRACGCPLGDLGWTTHLHTIRSDEKLTAGGMNFFDGDLVHVLEDVLPARFGGGPTDYQLIEDEVEGGHRALRLVVDPSVGPLDERAVSEAFLGAIGRARGAGRVTELLWRDAGILRVERRPPVASTGGKIIHLHVRPRPSAGQGALR